MSWKITRDLLHEKDPKSFPKSVAGKHTKQWTDDLLKGSLFHFKLYDDDGELYYEGVNTDETFGPLDWAMNDSGCTYIKYKQKGKGGKWEILNPKGGANMKKNPISEQRAREMGYGYTGIYEHTIEDAHNRAKKRYPGYKYVIISKKASGYERKAGVRKGMILGYSVYIEPKCVKDEAIKNIKTELNNLPLEKEYQLKKYNEELTKLNEREASLITRLKELESKNPLTKSERKELRNIRIKLAAIKNPVNHCHYDGSGKVRWHGHFGGGVMHEHDKYHSYGLNAGTLKENENKKIPKRRLSYFGKSSAEKVHTATAENPSRSPTWRMIMDSTPREELQYYANKMGMSITETKASGDEKLAKFIRKHNDDYLGKELPYPRYHSLSYDKLSEFRKSVKNPVKPGMSTKNKIIMGVAVAGLAYLWWKNRTPTM